MKKLILLFVATLALVSFKAQEVPEFNIVGKWKGTDKGDTGYLILDKEGYATFTFKGETMGGKEYDMGGEKASMKYVIDYTKSPIEIDFNVTMKTSGGKGTLPGIFKVVNKDEMIMAIGFGGVGRPKNFEGSDKITFRRVKE